jgi:hypothetical protein
LTVFVLLFAVFLEVVLLLLGRVVFLAVVRAEAFSFAEDELAAACFVFVVAFFVVAEVRRVVFFGSAGVASASLVSVVLAAFLRVPR